MVLPNITRSSLISFQYFLGRTFIFEKPKMIYGVFYAKTVKQIDDTIERILMGR